MAAAMMPVLSDGPAVFDAEDKKWTRTNLVDVCPCLIGPCSEKRTDYTSQTLCSCWRATEEPIAYQSHREKDPDLADGFDVKPAGKPYTVHDKIITITDRHHLGAMHTGPPTPLEAADPQTRTFQPRHIRLVATEPAEVASLLDRVFGFTYKKAHGAAFRKLIFAICLDSESNIILSRVFVPVLSSLYPPHLATLSKPRLQHCRRSPPSAVDLLKSRAQLAGVGAAFATRARLHSSSRSCIRGLQRKSLVHSSLAQSHDDFRGVGSYCAVKAPPI
jgi:hypothetical protein